MEQINWAGLAPSWPMIAMLASVFIYLVRLGINQGEQGRAIQSFRAELDERMLSSSKEYASWLHNLDESKIKPVERDIVRVEKETAKLGVMISDEYKALRHQHMETHKELVDMKILVAKMSEQLSYLLKEK